MKGEDAQEGIAHKEEPLELMPPSPGEEAILQEWCNQEHVSLPMRFPASSDGEIKPLSSKEQDELKAHVLSGHLTYVISLGAVFLLRALAECIEQCEM